MAPGTLKLGRSRFPLKIDSVSSAFRAAEIRREFSGQTAACQVGRLPLPQYRSFMSGNFADPFFNGLLKKLGGIAAVEPKVFVNIAFDITKVI